MLAILDPTSWVGRELTARLAGREPLRLFHSGADDEHLIAEVGGDANLVAPLSDPGELDGARVVVLTAPPDPRRGALLLEWLRAHRHVTLLDASQPGLAPDECTTVLTSGAGGGWLHVADPAVALAAHLLLAMRPLQPRSAALTVLRPASTFGPVGVEELAAQAAARLSGRAPRRAVALPRVIAFDATVASAGDRERLQAQLAALVGGVSVTLSLFDIGMFHGHAAVMTVECAAEPAQEDVLAALRRAPLRLARAGEQLRSSAAVDTERIGCAHPILAERRVTIDAVGDGFRLAGAAAVLDVLDSLGVEAG